MMQDRIQELVGKYLNGTATEEERQELLTWYRNEAGKTSEWPLASPEEKTLLKERMLGNLLQHIGKTKPRKRFTLLKYAAVFVLLVLSGLITRKLFQKTPVQQSAQIITTGYGERKKVQLPDGTLVWLGPASTLTCPEKFIAGKREVSMEGEAFFEVMKNEENPFFVHTGKLSTQVLGTSFNIYAYPADADVKVTLLSGSVMLTQGTIRQHLRPLEQGVFNKTTGGIDAYSYPDAAAMLERRAGNISYSNITVAAVATDLERMFGVKITTDGSTSGCVFYGRLKNGEDIDAFLNKLCIVVNARLIKKGEQYIITQGNCR